MVSRMSEEGLESLDKNESKMDEGLEVCQNSSIDDFMRGLDIFKVVHTERGTVEFIINDHRHGVPKGTVELEKKHASEYKKKMEVDMKKEFEEKLEEASRRHAKKMEAKEKEWNAEIKKAVEAKEIELRAKLKEANARCEKETKAKSQAMAGEKKAKDALTKSRAGSEERKAQLVVAKEQYKNEKEKREKAVNLHKGMKLELAKALKECDENRVIQERIDANRESEVGRLTESLETVKRDAAEAEFRHAKVHKERDENRVIQERIDANRESEIVRLTESLEKVERDVAEAEIRHASMNAALVQVVTPLRDDRRKASKMETIEQPEEQNSAVADAKCADGETETEDQRVVADDEAEVVDLQIREGRNESQILKDKAVSDDGFDPVLASSKAVYEWRKKSDEDDEKQRKKMDKMRSDFQNKIMKQCGYIND